MIWLVLGLLALTFLINHLVLVLGSADLDYHFQLRAGDYEIGEPIPITSILENNKLLTVSYLKVEEYFPKNFSAAKNTYSVFIFPFQRVRRLYNVFAQKRGLYKLNRAVLEFGDFIGLKSRRRGVAFEKEVVILPRKKELGSTVTPYGPIGGDVSVRRWIIDDPLMTIGIREYIGNEPQRFIHWPSTAKRGSLMVKKFDFTADNQVLVILNVETMKPRWRAVEEELIDEGVSLARGVLEDFESLNIPCGLMTNAYNEEKGGRGYYHPPGLGGGHLAESLHTLGRIHYHIPGFFETTLQEARRIQGNFTTGVVITPRILESYIEPINLLAKVLPRTIVIAIEPEYLDVLSDEVIKYKGKSDV